MIVMALMAILLIALLTYCTCLKGLVFKGDNDFGCCQTWKKVWTRGHCPRKFLRNVEISGLWKIDYSYFGIKSMNCENFLLTIKYLVYL